MHEFYFLPSSALAKTQPQLGCAGIKPNFSNRPPGRMKKYEAGTFEPGLQKKFISLYG